MLHGLSEAHTMFQVSMDITASRRWKLSSEIDKFFVHFSTGEEVKLRGKFHFALDARFRCVGRSGMQALVRRQFFFFRKCSKLTMSVTLALRTFRAAP